MQLRREMLLAPRLRPGILLTIQQHTGQPHNKDTPAPSVDSVDGEKLSSAENLLKPTYVRTMRLYTAQRARVLR